MSKKTKVAILILVIALIIVLAIGTISIINSFKSDDTGAEALNETQINGIVNNIETNNIENTEQENNVVNEEVNNTENTNNTAQGNSQTSDNANNSNEEKAIELVKKEWGEDSSVYFDLAGVTSDGKYRVSVNKDTKVLAWYIVDIETETVTQKSEEKMEDNKEINFEDTMKKLENIANELEKGDLDLDTSVSKFEEGMKLSKKCNEILENAEKRISILINNGEDIKEEDFVPKAE